MLVSLSLLLLLLSLFLLFSQEPLGAWKYSNPSFLYCLAPLHRLASSCLEGWRCGHECCSSRCSSQISSSHFLLLIWLSLTLSPCDFLSLSFRPPPSLPFDSLLWISHFLFLGRLFIPFSPAPSFTFAVNRSKSVSAHRQACC